MRTLAVYFGLILMVGMMKTNAQNSDYMRMIESAIKAPSGHNTQILAFYSYFYLFYAKKQQNARLSLFASPPQTLCR